MDIRWRHWWLLSHAQQESQRSALSAVAVRRKKTQVQSAIYRWFCVTKIRLKDVLHPNEPGSPRDAPSPLRAAGPSHWQWSVSGHDQLRYDSDTIDWTGTPLGQRRVTSTQLRNSLTWCVEPHKATTTTYTTCFEGQENKHAITISLLVACVYR